MDGDFPSRGSHQPQHLSRMLKEKSGSPTRPRTQYLNTCNHSVRGRPRCDDVDQWGLWECRFGIGLDVDDLGGIDYLMGRPICTVYTVSWTGSDSCRSPVKKGKRTVPRAIRFSRYIKKYYIFFISLFP